MDEMFFQNIFHLLIDTNSYQSPYSKTVGDPEPILTPLIRKKALQTALISAGFNLVPSYLGYIATLGEMFILLRLQAQMVKDIAVIFGREKELNKDILLYCLFKNLEPNLWKGFIRFIGSRIFIKPTSYLIFIQLLKKIYPQIGAKFESKIWRRTFSFIGTLGLSTIAFLDTKMVAYTAVQVFSKEIVYES